MPGSGTSVPLVVVVLPEVVVVVLPELVEVSQVMWPQPHLCVCQPLVEPPLELPYHQVAEAGAAAVKAARAAAEISVLRSILRSP